MSSDLAAEVDRLTILVSDLSMKLRRLETKVEEAGMVCDSQLRVVPHPVQLVRSSRTPPRKVCVLFDFETGGLGKTESIRVCQCAAIAVDESLRVRGRFSQFVNPTIQMDADAIATHGFSQEFVSNFPTWATVGLSFMNFLNDVRENNEEIEVTLSAHNGKRFDARILVFENARHRIEFPRNVYHSDSIEVFKVLYPGQTTYSLGQLYKSVMGADFEGAHDATADTSAVLDLLLNKECSEMVFNTIVAKRETMGHVTKRCFKT